jgi:hypothetical protein
MKKILVGLSILAIVLLTGYKGQVQADYGNTEDYKLPNVTRISQWNSMGYSYLIDNNTGVVYLENNSSLAITVMYNADGTLMKEKDIKKE